MASKDLPKCDITLTCCRSGRPVRITSAAVEVSDNSYKRARDGDGLLVSLEFHGILPGCRKVKHLSTMICAGSVRVSALFDYNGEAYISAADWREFIRQVPVISDWVSPIAVDDRARAMAWEECGERTAAACEREDREAAVYRAELQASRG